MAVDYKDLEFKGTIQRLLGKAYEIKKALGRTLVNKRKRRAQEDSAED